MRPPNPYGLQYPLQPMLYGAHMPPIPQYQMQQPYQNQMPALPDAEDSSTDESTTDDGSEDSENTSETEAADDQEGGQYVFAQYYHLDNKNHILCVSNTY